MCRIQALNFVKKLISEIIFLKLLEIPFSNHNSRIFPKFLSKNFSNFSKSSKFFTSATLKSFAHIYILFCYKVIPYLEINRLTPQHQHFPQCNLCRKQAFYYVFNLLLLVARTLFFPTQFPLSFLIVFLFWPIVFEKRIKRTERQGKKDSFVASELAVQSMISPSHRN